MVVAGAPHMSASVYWKDVAATVGPPDTTTRGLEAARPVHDTRISVGLAVSVSRTARGSL